MRQPDSRDGGAVNAIEEAVVVLEAIRAVRRESAQRDGLATHSCRAPRRWRRCAAGEWPVTFTGGASGIRGSQPMYENDPADKASRRAFDDELKQYIGQAIQALGHRRVRHSQWPDPGGSVRPL